MGYFGAKPRLLVIAETPGHAIIGYNLSRRDHHSSGTPQRGYSVRLAIAPQTFEAEQGDDDPVIDTRAFISSVYHA